MSKLLCSALVAAALAATLTPALAFEPAGPTELILWDGGKLLNPLQEEVVPFRVELGWRYFFDNNRPVQIGRPEDASPAKHEFRFASQIRLLEIPDWGKFEAYLAPSFATSEDVPDRAKVAVEVGYTIAKIRLLAGSAYELNVGAWQPGRGLGHAWAGACVAAISLRNLLVDGCGRYYLVSNSPAEISNKVGSRGAVKAEVAAHAYYRSGPVVFMVQPYGLLNGEFDRGGLFAGIRYNAGEQMKFLPPSLRGVAIEVLAKAGTDGRREEHFFGVGASWILR